MFENCLSEPSGLVDGCNVVTSILPGSKATEKLALPGESESLGLFCTFSIMYLAFTLLVILSPKIALELKEKDFLFNPAFGNTSALSKLDAESL